MLVVVISDVVFVVDFLLRGADDEIKEELVANEQMMLVTFKYGGSGQLQQHRVSPQHVH